ncbi:hypothetical protein V5O48_019004, partial [Marasmius crinis-equi]
MDTGHSPGFDEDAHLRAEYGEFFTNLAAGEVAKRRQTLDTLRAIVAQEGTTLEELTKFFEHDFLLIKDLINEFPSSTHLQNWLSKGCSVEALLTQDMPSYDIGPTMRLAHDSCATNARYNADPIGIDVDEEKLRTHISGLFLLIRVFDQMEKPWFMRPTLEPHYMSLEGDVGTYCIVSVIRPVITMVNAILTWQNSRFRLSVRSQASKSGRAFYVNHVIYLHGLQDHWQNDKRGMPIVLHKEKVHSSCAQFVALAELRSEEVLKASVWTEVAKVVGQIRKYVFEMETVYSVISDGRYHISAIWGQADESWVRR